MLGVNFYYFINCLDFILSKSTPDFNSLYPQFLRPSSGVSSLAFRAEGDSERML